MEVFTTCDRSAGNRKTVAMWLHRKHGLQASELQPLASAGTTRCSAAEAFVANPANCRDEIVGVPCRIEGMQLCVEKEGTQESHAVAQLFLAEVSCARLSSPCWPSLALIAVVPPAGEPGLRGTAINGADMTGAPAWFALAQGTEETRDILDALSMLGCLRSDLEQSFTPPTDGDGIIGEGAYATVQCMHCRDGTPVAVKKMNAQVELEAIEREVATLLHVQSHEHIVGYRGIFWCAEKEAVRLSVVFDVAPCGDLLYKVLKFGAKTEATARPLFTGILSGLAYIHSHNIVHRDIKAENVLLKSEDCAVVADFGLATWITDESQMARRCGSPGYVAPEVCLGTPYCFKVDVFGAGIVLFFMLSKEMPFSTRDRDTAATMRRTVKCSLHLHRPPWDTMSSRLRNVLRQMICKQAEERLSAAAVLEHPWMVMTSDKKGSGEKKEPGEKQPLEDGLEERPPQPPAVGMQSPAVASTGYPRGPDREASGLPVFRS